LRASGSVDDAPAIAEKGKELSRKDLRFAEFCEKVRLQ